MDRTPTGIRVSQDRANAELDEVEQLLALFQRIAKDYWRRPRSQPFVLGYGCIQAEMQWLLKEQQRLKEGVQSGKESAEGWGAFRDPSSFCAIRRAKRSRF